MVNYDQMLSDRVKVVKPSGIRRFFEMAAKMPHAISLGVGEPDFETPWQIRRAGIQSLEKGQTFYTSNWGLAELRSQIAALARRKYQLCYDADKEILVTVGGSEAIDNTIRALVNPGEEVLIPEPSFVCYTPLTQMAGGVPVPLPTRVEDKFKLTPEALRAAITPRTKLLILPYPNNPTGAIMDRDELQAIANVIRLRREQAKQRKSGNTELLNYKSRIIDLVETFLTKQPCHRCTGLTIVLLAEVAETLLVGLGEGSDG